MANKPAIQSAAQPMLDPDLVAIWERGGKSTLAIGPIDLTDALALRHRLYRLRLRMYAIRHPAAEVAARASIKLYPPRAKQVQLIVYPSNQLIATALKEAGIVTNPPEPPPLD